MKLKIAVCVFFAAVLYTEGAWMTFQYRNPKANAMSFYRDFRAVMLWKKLDKYQ